MNGSKKQKKWAESIKAQFQEIELSSLQEMKNMLQEMKDEGIEGEELEECLAIYDFTETFIAAVVKVSDAKFWIDNRSFLNSETLPASRYVGCWDGNVDGLKHLKHNNLVKMNTQEKMQ